MTTEAEFAAALNRLLGPEPTDDDIEWWAHRTKIEMLRRKQSASAKARWKRQKEDNDGYQHSGD